jgi:hypothetical protein
MFSLGEAGKETTRGEKYGGKENKAGIILL